MLPFVDKANFDNDISEALSEDAKEFACGCSRGRNEPATMPVVCEYVAAFMSKSPEEVAHQGTINAHSLQNTDEWQWQELSGSNEECSWPKEDASWI